MKKTDKSNGVVRVNLGCGSKLMPMDMGWINVDIVSPPEVVLDSVAEITSFPYDPQELTEKTQSIFLASNIKDMKNIKTGSVHEVHAYHVIEHFAVHELNDVVKEILRILNPEVGCLVCEQPDIIKCAKNLLQVETTKDQNTWYRLGLMGMFGEQDPNAPYMQHKWGWYPASLSEFLAKFGFKYIYNQPALTHMKELRDFRLVAFVNNVPKDFAEKGKASTEAPTYKGLGLHNSATGRAENLLVSPRDSVPEVAILTNIQTNIAAIDRWIERARPHTRKAFIVSAGPSLKGHIGHIKTHYDKARGDTIYCVKHALPILLEAGIIPDFCVVLDPRPLDGVSTHGKVRKDLFKDVPKETTFLIASMTNPAVTEHIKALGGNIVGWHAYASGIDKFLHTGIKLLISGGTSAGMRTINLCYNLGFRDITLIGFDSSMAKDYVISEQDQELIDLDGRKKFVEVFYKDPENKFYSTGELMAQAQDIIATLESPNDIVFDMWCEGMAGEIWKDYKERFDIKEYNPSAFLMKKAVV